MRVRRGMILVPEFVAVNIVAIIAAIGIGLAGMARIADISYAKKFPLAIQALERPEDVELIHRRRCTTKAIPGAVGRIYPPRRRMRRLELVEPLREQRIVTRHQDVACVQYPPRLPPRRDPGRHIHGICDEERTCSGIVKTSNVRHHIVDHGGVLVG